MSEKLKELFDKEIGISCAFIDKPQHVICYDHSTHVALYDLNIYHADVQFKKFSMAPIPTHGYALRGRMGFKCDYIRAANEILNPNEWGIITLKNRRAKEIAEEIEEDIPEMQDILLLKRGSYAIAIAPRIFDTELEAEVMEGFSVINLNKIIKKTASSAMVW